LLVAVIVSLFILLAATVVITTVRAVAQREIVLESRGMLRAVGNAFRLFKRKLGQLGLMWLVLFSIDLAVGLVTLPLTLLGGMALSLPFDLLTKGTAPTLPDLLLAIPLLLIIALVGLFLNGIYQAFRSAVWTLTYREAAEPMAEIP
jgi:hypothetical protein